MENMAKVMNLYEAKSQLSSLVQCLHEAHL
jgi:hypothetical protein